MISFVDSHASFHYYHIIIRHLQHVGSLLLDIVAIHTTVQ